MERRIKIISLLLLISVFFSIHWILTPSNSKYKSQRIVFERNKNKSVVSSSMSSKSLHTCRCTPKSDNKQCFIEAVEFAVHNFDEFVETGKIKLVEKFSELTIKNVLYWILTHESESL